VKLRGGFLEAAQIAVLNIGIEKETSQQTKSKEEPEVTDMMISQNRTLNVLNNFKFFIPNLSNNVTDESSQFYLLPGESILHTSNIVKM